MSSKVTNKHATPKAKGTPAKDRDDDILVEETSTTAAEDPDLESEDEEGLKE